MSIVFVGIDVHVKSYSVAIVKNNEIIKSFRMLASPQKLIDNLRKHYPEDKIKSVYEAGFSGLSLHRNLIEAGIENIVVNPASIEVAANDRCKTDKRDARKLAWKLSINELKGIIIPSIETENRRRLTRTREEIVSKRVRTQNQIKQLIYYHNLLPEIPSITAKFVNTLEEIAADLPDDLRISLETLLSEWRFYTLKLVEFRRHFRAQAARDKPKEMIYQSVPGVGPIAARTLSNELGDTLQFKSTKAVYKATGLTPGEYSSGEAVRRGHISRQGSSRLRYILTEVAWRAIGSDPALSLKYNILKSRIGGKKAIIAIARNIIGRIRACFKKNEPYMKGLLHGKAMPTEVKEAIPAEV